MLPKLDLPESPLHAMLVAMNTTVPTLEDLRPELIERVQSLPVEQLIGLRNYLLDLEIQRLAGEIDADFDQADAAGKLTPEAIGATIQAFRERKPYR